MYKLTGISVRNLPDANPTKDCYYFQMALKIKAIWCKENEYHKICIYPAMKYLKSRLGKWEQR